MLGQKHVRDQGETLNSDSELELSASDESEPEEQPSRVPFDSEVHPSDDDGEAEVCAPAAAPTAESTFTLSGGSLAFSDRSRSIFDCLDSVKRQTASSLNQESSAGSRTSLPPPNCPIPPKKRGVPDYLVHPERWTHYSLEDVSETSDQDNCRAAYQFLSTLRQERDSPCDTQQRMIFSRPKRPQVTAQLSPDEQGKKKRLQLSHLSEEDENEEGRERKETRKQILLKNEQGQKEKDKDVSEAVDPAEEKKFEESNLSFTTSRKMKSYRKSSGQEDD